MHSEFDSLEKQIANLKENLNIINEKCAEYIHSVDIPVQLIRDKRRVEGELVELREKQTAFTQAARPAPLPPELARAPNPYRGLEPFEAEHAANYFGRTAMVDKLLEKLTANNFVAVVGHTRGVKAVSFSPDGRQVVSGSDDRTVQIWLVDNDLLAQAAALIQREPPIFTDEERRRFLHEA